MALYKFDFMLCYVKQKLMDLIVTLLYNDAGQVVTHTCSKKHNTVQRAMMLCGVMVTVDLAESNGNILSCL